MKRVARILGAVFFCACILVGLAVLGPKLGFTGSFWLLLAEYSAFLLLALFAQFASNRRFLTKAGPVLWSLGLGLFFFLFGCISDWPQVRLGINLVPAAAFSVLVFVFMKWGPSRDEKVQALFGSKSEGRPSR